ncbi:hypothetical protein ACFX2I_031929 [Malus domestica]
MHTKTDSEVTNLAPSSPTRSPSRCPIYFVQSASRDSHNGEKTATSFQSTPIISPSGSPPTPIPPSAATHASPPPHGSPGHLNPDPKRLTPMTGPATTGKVKNVEGASRH